MRRKIEHTDAFKALFEELGAWMQGNDYNGSLEFAFRNGFKLHAVSLWQNTGASNLPGVAIPRARELKQIHELCAYADVFICPDCNHHAFFSPGEIPEDTVGCESCCKTMKIDSRSKS